MKYEIELSEELVDFFQSALAVLDLKYPNPESMLKHILLEGLEHRLEHFSDSHALSFPEGREQHITISQAWRVSVWNSPCGRDRSTGCGAVVSWRRHENASAV